MIEPRDVTSISGLASCHQPRCEQHPRGAADETHRSQESARLTNRHVMRTLQKCVGPPDQSSAPPYPVYWTLIYVSYILDL